MGPESGIGFVNLGSGIGIWDSFSQNPGSGIPDCRPLEQSERAPLVILVKAVGKFGPVFEYFNLLIKPLSEMLASPHSDDALKYAILVVLATRIAIDAMPDYYMVLSD